MQSFLKSFSDNRRPKVTLLRHLLLYTTFVTLSGCGGLQSLKVAEVPALDEASVLKLSQHRPKAESVSPQSIAIPEKSLYLKGPRGNAAWFLLLGIPGMVINSELIDQKTQKIMSSGQESNLYSIDALFEARQALKIDYIESHDASNIILKPYILFYVKEEGLNIKTIVGIRVERKLTTTGKVSDWAGQYNYALNHELPYNYLEETLPETKLVNYKKLIRTAFIELKEEIDKDLTNPTNKKRKIANVEAPIVLASRLGFAGFVWGDSEINPTGKLVMRLNSDNWGTVVDDEVFYVLWVFPDATQYKTGEMLERPDNS